MKQKQQIDAETRKAFQSYADAVTRQSALMWWRSLEADEKVAICEKVGEDFDMVKNSSSKIERIFKQL